MSVRVEKRRADLPPIVVHRADHDGPTWVIRASVGVRSWTLVKPSGEPINLFGSFFAYYDERGDD